MADTKLDILIIADARGYENVAFPTGLSELAIDGEVMTIQNLMTHFRKKSQGDACSAIKANVLLSDTGKLNGILLYDYCRRHNLQVELLQVDKGQSLEDYADRTPTVVALSTTWMMSKKMVLAIASHVKKVFPDTYIVAGGPLIINSKQVFNFEEQYNITMLKNDYFFLDEDAYRQESLIDLYIAEQQGLEELVEVCNRLKTGRDPREISNAVFYDQDQVHFTATQEMGHSICNEAVDWGQLPGHILPEIVPLQFSTGCPFKCTFCNFTHRRKIQKKPIDVVKQELAALAKREKVKFIRLVDETMTPHDFRNLCKTMEEVDCRLPWTTFARADAISDDIPKILNKANCSSVQIGFESFDNDVLKVMNKRVTTTRYREAIQWLLSEDVPIRGTLIAGHPGETPQTFDNTLKFLNSIDYPTDSTFEFLFAPFVLLPLSPAYDSKFRAEYGLEGYMMEWKHKTMAASDVNQLLFDAFMSMGDNALYVYVQDDVNSDLPKHVLRQVKIHRQRARKQQILLEQGKKESKESFAKEIKILENILQPFI